MKKIVIILAIAVAVVILIFAIICFVIPVLILGGFMPPAPNYTKVDKYLKANIDTLSYVADALFELDYDSISIRENSQLREEEKNSMKVSREYLVYETIPIPDELLGHIEALHKSGISVISCGRDSIGFTMWSSMDESRGIIYSRTGEKADDIIREDVQLIEVKQLSEENWYYYVHNFEKAKARNPHLFQ